MDIFEEFFNPRHNFLDPYKYEELTFDQYGTPEEIQEQYWSDVAKSTEFLSAETWLREHGHLN